MRESIGWGDVWLARRRGAEGLAAPGRCVSRSRETVTPWLCVTPCGIHIVIDIAVIRSAGRAGQRGLNNNNNLGTCFPKNGCASAQDKHEQEFHCVEDDLKFLCGSVCIFLFLQTSFSGILWWFSACAFRHVHHFCSAGMVCTGAF